VRQGAAIGSERHNIGWVDEWSKEHYQPLITAMRALKPYADACHAFRHIDPDPPRIEISKPHRPMRSMKSCEYEAIPLAFA
jgi:hypothetical protein